jgi:hypothetical protein
MIKRIGIYLILYSGRVMLGETNPRDSKPGTIRGDFCIQVSELFIFPFHIASRKPERLVVNLEDTVLYLSYTKKFISMVLGAFWPYYQILSTTG